MATPVAAAAEAVAQQVPRRFGNKQVFLFVNYPLDLQALVQH